MRPHFFKEIVKATLLLVLVVSNALAQTELVQPNQQTSFNEPVVSMNDEFEDSLLTSNELFAEARSLEMLGKDQEAYLLYDKSFGLNRNNYRSIYRAGRLLKKFGEVDRAITAFHRCIYLANDFYPAYNSLGVTLSEKGDLERSINAHKSGTLAAPDYAPAWRNLGRAYSEINDNKNAIAAYLRALKIEENHIPTRIKLGILFAREKKILEAKHHLNRVLKSDPTNRKALEAMAYVEGKPERLLDEIPVAHLAIPEAEDATSFEKAWSYSLPNTKLENPDGLKFYGIDALHRGNFEDAVDILEKAVDYGDRDHETHAALAYSHYRMGHYRRAADIYKRAVEVALNPKPWYMLNRGLALEKIGEMQEAAYAYAEAIKIDPTFGRAHYALGLVRIQRGDIKTGLKSLKRAIYNDPGFADGHKALAVAWLQRGKIEFAIESYQDALAIRKNDPESTMSLAKLLERQGYFNDAVDLYSDFIEITMGNEIYSGWRNQARQKINLYMNMDTAQSESDLAENSRTSRGFIR
jgi:tetratricopeptide (TPR) repeat protein